MNRQDAHAVLIGKDPKYYIVSSRGEVVAKRCAASNRWLPITEFYKSRGAYGSNCKEAISFFARCKRDRAKEQTRDKARLSLGQMTESEYTNKWLYAREDVFYTNKGFETKEDFIDAHQQHWIDNPGLDFALSLSAYGGVS